MQQLFLRYVLCVVILGTTGKSVAAILPDPCAHAPAVTLNKAVTLSANEQARLNGMHPLRVVAMDAWRPLSYLDTETNRPEGIGVDVFCALAAELHLPYEFVDVRQRSINEQFSTVQTGENDLFIAASFLPSRAQAGVFTKPYFRSDYVLVTNRHHELPTVSRIADLHNERVGVADGSAMEPVLKRLLPPQNLYAYDVTDTNRPMYDALLNDEIDVAVVNRYVFEEDRYANRRFDLVARHTLHENPRQYAFYLHKSGDKPWLAGIFDRYLDSINLSSSMRRHQDGEHRFLQDYERKQKDNQMLRITALAGILLLLISLYAWWRSKVRATQLTHTQEQIQAQVAALRQTNETLKKLSITDSLTGLANRSHFDDCLSREIRRAMRHPTPLSLILFDLDHFKQINDTFGHSTGDEYLQKVAQVLSSHCRRSHDVAARFGGEEFVCLLPHTTQTQAYAIAESIRRNIQGLTFTTDRDKSLLPITISGGVCTFEAPLQATAADLIRCADRALYQAKAQGRNRICVEDLCHHMQR